MFKCLLIGVLVSISPLAFAHHPGTTALSATDIEQHLKNQIESAVKEPFKPGMYYGFDLDFDGASDIFLTFADPAGIHGSLYLVYDKTGLLPNGARKYSVWPETNVPTAPIKNDQISLVPPSQNHKDQLLPTLLVLQEVAKATKDKKIQ